MAFDKKKAPLHFQTITLAIAILLSYNSAVQYPDYMQTEQWE